MHKSLALLFLALTFTSNAFAGVCWRESNSGDGVSESTNATTFAACMEYSRTHRGALVMFSPGRIVVVYTEKDGDNNMDIRSHVIVNFSKEKSFRKSQRSWDQYCSVKLSFLPFDSVGLVGSWLVVDEHSTLRLVV